MHAKGKSHCKGLTEKCTVLLLCLLLAIVRIPAGAESEVLMYAADGRTLSVAAADVEAYRAVGWYTEPFVLMYAADGRTLNVNSAETEAYKAVGWYPEPVTLMYAADGRTLYVLNSEVEAYKAVGWYTTRQAAASSFPDLSSYGTSSGGSTQNISGTVYRGRTGTKYHRSSCPTLKRGGAYPVSLSDAIGSGRTACKVCKP